MNKLAKKLLFWGGALVIAFVFCKNKSLWIVLVWVFAWGGFVRLINGFIRGWNGRRKKSEESAGLTDPRFNTPRKALLVSLNYHISHALFLFNPFLVLQSFLQIAGAFGQRYYGCPVWQAEQYKQRGNYILPFAGEWRVVNGGVTRQTSHYWGIPSQRFAYDFVKFGQNGRSFAGDGRKLTDYFCFDAPILAPADGMVIKARDGLRDAPFVGTFWMDCLARNIGGNSVLIKHADGEFCFLAHLKRGSICVKVGDRVKQGQEIGRCGHSGNSTEPHLHFQFQDGKSLYFNNGLPVKFSGFRWRNGEQESFVGQDYISKNIFVETGE